MNRIGVYNETKKFVNKWHISKLAKKILKVEGKDNCECNIIIVDDETIKKINHDYRDIDAATDVLSFAFNDGDNESPYQYEVLGDIYISYDKVLIQSVEYGHTKKRELSFLVVHGMYHLLGYDHQNETEQKQMREKEEGILNGSKSTRRK